MKRSFLYLGWTALWLWALPAAAEDIVRYDEGRDRVILVVDDVPLSTVLKTLAGQGSLDVRLDPAADRKVSASFRDIPLEDAIDRVAGKLNLIKAYGPVGPKEKRPLLTGITILPAGKTDASQARSLLADGDELQLRAAQQARRNTEPSRGASAAEARWKARLATLPPARRTKYEELLESQQRTREKSLQQRAERDRRQQEKAAAREAKQQAIREKRGETAAQEKRPYNPDSAARAREMFDLPDAAPAQP